MNVDSSIDPSFPKENHFSMSLDLSEYPNGCSL